MALLNAENLFILLSPAEGWESDTESFVTALYLLLYAFYSIYSHHNRGKKKKIKKIHHFHRFKVGSCSAYPPRLPVGTASRSKREYSAL